MKRKSLIQFVKLFRIDKIGEGFVMPRSEIPNSKNERVYDKISVMPKPDPLFLIEKQQRTSHRLAIQEVILFTDDKIAVACNDNTIRIYDLKSKKQISVFITMQNINSMVLKNDKLVVALGTSSYANNPPKIVVFDIKTGVRIQEFSYGNRRIQQLKLDPRERIIGLTDSNLFQYDLEKNEILMEISRYYKPLDNYQHSSANKPRIVQKRIENAIRFKIYDDGSAIINTETSFGYRRKSRSEVFLIENYEEQENQNIKTFFGHKECILSFDANDTLVATGSADKTIRINNRTGTSKAKILREQETSITALEFLSDGRLITGGSDGSIYVWNPINKKALAKWDAHTSGIKDFLMIPGGKMISYTNNTIKFWDLKTYKCLKEITISINLATNVASAFQDRKQIINDSGKIKPLSDGRTVQINKNKIEIYSPNNILLNSYTVGSTNLSAFLIDDLNRIIVSQASSYNVKEYHIFVVSPNSGRILQTLKGHKKGITSLAFSTNNTLISTAQDGIIKWSMKDWSVINRYQIPVNGGFNDIFVRYIPNDLLFIATVHRKSYHIYSLETGELVKQIDSVVDLNRWRETFQIIPIKENTFFLYAVYSRRLILYEELGNKITEITQKKNFHKILELTSGDLMSQTDKSIAYLPLNENLIFVALANGDFRLFDNNIENFSIKSYKQTFTGHTKLVKKALELDDDLIATISYEGIIKIWNITTGKCIETISFEGKPVLDLLKLPNKNLLVISKNSQFITDIKGKILFTLERNYSEFVVHKDGYIIANNPSSYTDILNANDGSLIFTLDREKGKEMKLFGVNFEGEIYFKTPQGSLRSWDLHSGVLLKTVFPPLPTKKTPSLQILHEQQKDSVLDTLFDKIETFKEFNLKTLVIDVVLSKLYNHKTKQLKSISNSKEKLKEVIDSILLSLNVMKSVPKNRFVTLNNPILVNNQIILASKFKEKIPIYQSLTLTYLDKQKRSTYLTWLNILKLLCIELEMNSEEQKIEKAIQLFEQH